MPSKPKAPFLKQINHASLLYPSRFQILLPLLCILRLNFIQTGLFGFLHKRIQATLYIRNQAYVKRVQILLLNLLQSRFLRLIRCPILCKTSENIRFLILSRSLNIASTSSKLLSYSINSGLRHAQPFMPSRGKPLLCASPII